ncbi:MULTISPECIES: hypothetical protein [unclassified Leifsonia]|nr:MULTISPECIES: hypothetical protein [unclassified Leifsonia]TDP98908.1 hypothetical protein AXZ95_2813 [Leifsonia sp. 115AMFTsu3.1]
MLAVHSRTGSKSGRERRRPAAGGRLALLRVSRARLPGALSLVAVGLLLTACSLSYEGAKGQANGRANQKQAALTFLSDYPNPAVESITFTQEGSVGGAGFWAANAIVTIDGRTYDAILGPDRRASSSNPLPRFDPDAPAPTDVTVNYSDDTSEVVL